MPLEIDWYSALYAFILTILPGGGATALLFGRRTWTRRTLKLEVTSESGGHPGQGQDQPARLQGRGEPGGFESSPSSRSERSPVGPGTPIPLHRAI